MSEECSKGIHTIQIFKEIQFIIYLEDVYKSYNVTIIRLIDFLVKQFFIRLDIECKINCIYTYYSNSFWNLIFLY